jgi:dynein heavy chain
MPAPKPFEWQMLTNKGRVQVSPRAGHTITPMGSLGFVLYGGMDGRRNDQGNPAPNSDIYVLKLLPQNSFEWSMPDVEASSQIPPARTLHTVIANSSEEMVLFGGMHSTTPYQVLNDGWTLDVTTFEWRQMSFKSKSTIDKKGCRERVTGKIVDVLKRHHSVDVQVGGGRSSAKPSKLGFTSLAMAATKALKKADSGSVNEGKESSRNVKSIWKKALNRKSALGDNLLSDMAGQAAPDAVAMKPKKTYDKSSLLQSEEEQFHNDLLAMVSRASTTSEKDDGTKLPAPRSNHSASLYENTMVVFGGHGGHGYQRRAFNDVWSLNLDNGRWALMLTQGTPPTPRSGHAAFHKDGCVYIFGGWNSEMQFNDLFMLDVDNKDWSDLDLGWSTPRWNMSCQYVEAIPSSRVFIFGGSVDRLSEGRSMGSFDRKLGVLELGDERKWDEPVPIATPGRRPPPGREHAAVCYEPEDSRLIIFGGWANKWMDDVWQINVSSIVGPPYAIGRVEPALGPVSGNQKISVYGVGFGSQPCVYNELASNIWVSFTGLSSKFYAEAPGTFIHDELIECLTPVVPNSACPKECEVRVCIGQKAPTTTLAKYTYYLNTIADMSLCYGPGLLEDQQAGTPTRFIIQARNYLGENRKSGRDEWSVSVQQITAESPVHSPVRTGGTSGKDNNQEVPCLVQDCENGQYEVRYTANEGPLIIHVRLRDETGSLKPIRGSPFMPTMIKNAKNRANEYTGPLLNAWVSKEMKGLEEFYRVTEVGRSTKIADGDIKALLKVMDYIKVMYDRELDLTRRIDEVDETLKHFEREGIPNEKAVKLLKRISANLSQLKVDCEQTEKSIQPLRQSLGEVYRKKIGVFEEELRTYHGGLRKEAYCFYLSGLELAFERIQAVTYHLDAKTEEYKDLLLIATNFEYAEELEKAQKTLMQMRDEVGMSLTLWSHEKERMKLTEKFLVKEWGQIDANIMEEEVKASFKKMKEFKVDRKSDVFLGIQAIYKTWTIFCPLVGELRDPSMRQRHWNSIMELCGKEMEVDEHLLLRDMWNMDMHRFQSDVEDIAEQAKQEAKMESTLHTLALTWSEVEFEFESHRGSDVLLMKLKEEHVETLEENQVQVQNMFASRFLATFETEVVSWQRALSQVADTSILLAEVLRMWVFLENLFIHSEEVKKELPEESERFLDIDDSVKALLLNGNEIRYVKPFCTLASTYQVLEKTHTQLTMCQKALQEFMDGKRRAFPRFYFMSAADLLDVLSNGNNPAKVVPQFPKFFIAIERFELDYPDGEDKRPVAIGMHACVGREYVNFPEPLELRGKVEIYLDNCIEAFREALRHYVKQDLKAYKENVCEHDGIRRGQWLLHVKAAQSGLLVQLITWVQLVEEAFKAAQDIGQDSVVNAKKTAACLAA